MNKTAIKKTNRRVQAVYPYYGLGQIAEKLGDIETARDYYLKALTANPGYVPAAQSLTALNRARRTSIVLRPPPVRPPRLNVPIPGAKASVCGPTFAMTDWSWVWLLTTTSVGCVTVMLRTFVAFRPRLSLTINVTGYVPQAAL